MVLSLRSTESTEWQAGISFTPKLTIACKENTTQVSVFWNATIQGGDMTIRRDQETAQEVRWDVADSYEEAGLWSGRRSIPFIKSLIGHDRLVARIDPPYGQPEITAVFPISELGGVIGPLRRSCGW